MITIFLLITAATSQDLPTPASLLTPRNFNYHPYQIQFLRDNVQPTKKGPVLFPNDAPPSPRTPLIVTSRPLIESILRSDLNPTPKTTPSTSIHQPIQNNILNVPHPNQIFDQDKVPEAFNNIEYQATSYSGVPYNTLKTQGLGGYVSRNDYNDYEAKNFDYINYDDDPINHEYDDQKKNYAFSYTVRDRENGDDFSHSQQSRGSATNGEYRVRLPDGRIQIVSYTADKNGYNAKVRYDDDKDYNNNNYNIPKNDPNNYNLNINRNDKTIPVKEEQYNSNEYYDYPEYINNYQPYRSKFNFQQTIAPSLRTSYATTTYKPALAPIYAPTSGPTYASTIGPTYQPTARPIYTIIKDSVTRAPILTPTFIPRSHENIKDLYYTQAPNVYLNDLSASNSHIKDSTTENVVLIGNQNNYNNIKANNQVKPIVENSFVATTPASYLASTIASLRERIAAKTVLSSSFMDRINKYLHFK